MEPGNLIGKSLAGCRLVASVARGSMGEVFRGVHEALQRPVAVKVVHAETAEKPALDKLLVEARALAKLEHPNIVHVYAVGLQGALFYIVIQFLEGTPAGLLRTIGLRVPGGVQPGTRVRVLGGGTIVFDEFGRAKYHHRKDILDTGRQLAEIKAAAGNGKPGAH